MTAGAARHGSHRTGPIRCPEAAPDRAPRPRRHRRRRARAGPGPHRRHRRDRRRQDHGGDRARPAVRRPGRRRGGPFRVGPAMVEGRLSPGRRFARGRATPAPSSRRRTVLAGRPDGHRRGPLAGRTLGGRVGAGRRRSPSSPRTSSPCTGSPTSSGCSRPAAQRAALDRYAGPAVREPLDGYARGATRGCAAVGPSSRELRTRGPERAQEADLLRLRARRGRAGVDPQPGEDAALRRRGRPARPRRGAAAAADRRRTPRCSATPDDRVDGSRRARPSSGRPDGRSSRSRSTTPELAGLGRPAGRGPRRCCRRRRPRTSRRTPPASTPIRPDWRRSQERRAALRGADPQVRRRTSTSVLAWAERAGSRLTELGRRRRAHRGAARRSERSCGRRSAASAAQLSRRRPAAAERFARPRSPPSWPISPCRRRSVRRGRDAERGRRTGCVDRRRGRTRRRSARRGRRGRAAARAAPRRAGRGRWHEGASGGELSRVMLAVEVVLRAAPTRCRRSCSTRSTPVSAGGRRSRSAGGWRGWPATRAGARRHAPAAGRRLRRPAPGGRSRRRTARSPSSGVTALDEAGRVRELSRMLAGARGLRLGPRARRGAARRPADGRRRAGGDRRRLAGTLGRVAAGCSGRIDG